MLSTLTSIRRNRFRIHSRTFPPVRDSTCSRLDLIFWQDSCFPWSLCWTSRETKKSIFPKRQQIRIIMSPRRMKKARNGRRVRRRGDDVSRSNDDDDDDYYDDMESEGYDRMADEEAMESLSGTLRNLMDLNRRLRLEQSSLRQECEVMKQFLILGHHSAPSIGSHQRSSDQSVEQGRATLRPSEQQHVQYNSTGASPGPQRQQQQQQQQQQEWIPSATIADAGASSTSHLASVQHQPFIFPVRQQEMKDAGGGQEAATSRRVAAAAAGMQSGASFGSEPKDAEMRNSDNARSA